MSLAWLQVLVKTIDIVLVISIIIILKGIVTVGWGIDHRVIPIAILNLPYHLLVVRRLLGLVINSLLHYYPIGSIISQLKRLNKGWS